MTELDIQVIPQRDKRLGRQKVHDPRSRRFAVRAEVDKSTWRTKTIRVVDPSKNPNQCHGECTGCAKSMQFNSQGNRVTGVVLKMDDAHKLYTLASQLDPWPGSWPPDDTGSSGLASAKAAQQIMKAGPYFHIFNGADGVVQSIMDDKAVSVGTVWKRDMFDPDHEGIIEPTGDVAGGHQYLAHGFNLKRDLVKIRCWWGEYRDVWIHRTHLNDLIMDGGDAHVQDRVA